jgi:hypothetical protein
MRGDTYATRGGTEGEPLELVDGDPLDMAPTFLHVDQPVTVVAPPFEDTADLATPGGRGTGRPSDPFAVPQ